jgi:hypothetical protein
MNKKPSNCTFQNGSIETTYPNRDNVEWKVADDINDQCANWNGAPVAWTRLLHPFEYWRYETAAIDCRFEDRPTVPSMIKHSHFKPQAIAFGRLRDWAVTLFRQVRGP